MSRHAPNGSLRWFGGSFQLGLAFHGNRAPGRHNARGHYNFPVCEAVSRDTLVPLAARVQATLKCITLPVAYPIGSSRNAFVLL